MPNNASFIYSGLDLAEQEIRLVILQPYDETDERIKCTTVNAKISDKPKFQALSYAWGDSQYADLILLNGQEFRVGLSLWWALIYLREADKAQTFWIDAICIDQNNVFERNHQVTLMSHIYSEAETVIIWLGARKRVHLNFQPKPRAWITEENIVSDFAKKDYWKRLWVVQEVLLARKIILRLDVQWVEWGAFLAYFESWKGRNSKSSLIWSGQFTASIEELQDTGGSSMSRLIALKQKKETAIRAESLHLALLAETFREAKCFDKKDRVFGLLGLTGTCCQTEIVVDYEMSKESLLSSVFRHHVNCHHHTSESDIDLLHFGLQLSRALEIPVDEVKGLLFTKHLFEYTPYHSQSLGSLYQSRIISVIQLRNGSDGLTPSSNTDEMLSQELKSASLIPSSIFSGLGTHNSRLFRRQAVSASSLEELQVNESRSTFGGVVDISQWEQHQQDEVREKLQQCIHEAAKLLKRIGKLQQIDQYQLFWTDDGHLGLVHGCVQEGDIVCQFPGHNHPLIVHKEGDSHKVLAVASKTRDFLSNARHGGPFQNHKLVNEWHRVEPGWSNLDIITFCDFDGRPIIVYYTDEDSLQSFCGTSRACAQDLVHRSFECMKDKVNGASCTCGTAFGLL
jgi:hypothetical protein